MAVTLRSAPSTAQDTAHLWKEWQARLNKIIIARFQEARDQDHHRTISRSTGIITSTTQRT